MLALIIVQAAAVLLLGLLVAGLLRSHAEILRRLHQLGAGLEEDHSHDPFSPVGPEEVEGEEAHDLAGVTPAGETVVLPVTGVNHRTLLAFLSSGCLTCRVFWEAFAHTDRLGLPSDLRVVAVTEDPSSESPATIIELAPPGVPVLMSGAAWRDYHVPGSPYFVLIDGAGSSVVGEGSATAWEQLRDLLGVAMEERGGWRRLLRGDARRESRADRELIDAGIQLGHPSLYGPEQAEEDPR